MLGFSIVSAIIILGVGSFILLMNRKGETLDGDEESTPIIWADETWYQGDGPHDS